ncbi:MAG: purine-nucleoside phosphorylase [Hyphomicrobiales bacterium]
MLKAIQKTVDFLKEKIKEEIEIGIILGSGLGGLVDKLDIKDEFDYCEIPNFPISTVNGHEGKLIYGELCGRRVLAMLGRFHYYEGYSMEEIVFPIRVMKVLGVESLIVSNAAGGMNPKFNVGDVMLITDHINLLASNPLIGNNEDSLGPRFPNLNDAYDKHLICKASYFAEQNDISCHQGVYAAVSGPSFETPAEYKYLRIIGADAVGMSTVPEVIAAKHCGMKCFGMSVITDLGISEMMKEVSHSEVLQAAQKAEPNMTKIVSYLVSKKDII